MSKISPIEWDLSDLYKSISDPQITKDKNKTKKLVKLFTESYKGKINKQGITAKKLTQAIGELEGIFSLIYKYGIYSSLIKSKDTSSETIAAFAQGIDEFINEQANQLLFFELELVQIPQKKIKDMLKDKALSEYKHYIEHELIFKPYRLNESEEIVISKKAQTGSSAFVRLFNELNSNLKYELKVDGKFKELTYAELVPYLSNHPDRKLRQKAAESMSASLKDNSKLFAFILNTLLLDKKNNDEIRNYDYQEQSTYLGYQVDKEVVDKMVKVISSKYTISEKFYLHKKNVLGLKELYEWDRYSKVIDVEDTKYTWEESQEMVLDAFKEFSEEFYEIAKLFFDNKWIDAKVTKGKVAGAFCSLGLPDTHPYILLNFTGQLRDILTLAHELGHGIHAYMSRGQKLFQFWPSTAVAEIASVFCESIVFDKLINQIESKEQKAELLGDKIQDIFATIFRQTSFHLFEQDIHRARREEGELSIDRFGELFQNRLQEMFGTGLKLTDGHKNWWMPVGHFYNYNFYVFTYAFGETLATSLFAKYKKEGSKMVKQYTSALSQGGNRTPLELTEIMGADVKHKDFWINGLNLIDAYVTEFIELTK